MIQNFNLRLATAAVAILFFIIFNVMITKLIGTAQIDVTENNRYTVAEGSKEILKNIAEPIQFMFFYSSEQAAEFPEIQAHAARVKSMLKRYASLSGQKINLTIINPTPYSHEEDQAITLGIQGFKVNNSNERFYLGLVARNSIDSVLVIPYFDPSREAFLEYDLTKTVYTLEHIIKPTIGLMSWLPMEPGMIDTHPQPLETWGILTQMRQFFNVREIKKTTDVIPNSIDALMIAHPGDMSDATLYAIDQYIMKGGKALIITDPYLHLNGTKNRTSGLNRLFDKWGFRVSVQDAVMDAKFGIRVPVRTRDKSMLAHAVNPAWLEVTKAGLNESDIVTHNMNLMRLLSAGFFIEKETTEATAGLDIMPLITTSDAPSSIPILDLYGDVSPIEMMKNYTAEDKPKTIAARITGVFPTAFPDTKGPHHEKQSVDTANVVVITDADMLFDNAWADIQHVRSHQILTPTADNGSFVINTLDHLSGSEALIALRNRRDPNRKFQRVEELRAEADIRFRKEEEALNYKITTTEGKLQRLRNSAGSENTALLSQTTQTHMRGFRNELATTRQKLRAVRHELRKDILELGEWLKFLNIGLIPILMIILSLVIPARSMMRRKTTTKRDAT